MFEPKKPSYLSNLLNELNHPYCIVAFAMGAVMFSIFFLGNPLIGSTWVPWHYVPECFVALFLGLFIGVKQVTFKDLNWKAAIFFFAISAGGTAIGATLASGIPLLSFGSYVDLAVASILCCPFLVGYGFEKRRISAGCLAKLRNLES